ncbi:MAG: serine hydrolase [Anaerolineaceae bacterium]|nr:serine hydrolase [Anaerolineaceae bacterium]
MKRKTFPLLRWIAIGLLLIAMTLATIQLVSYSRIRDNFPLGLEVSGIPIGGLTYEEASERIYTVFRSPIELNYAGSLIQIRPAVLGFEPQVENMLAVADNMRVSEPFWSGFWNFLWNRNIEIINIPLNAAYDEARIRTYLETEIAARYDTPSSSPKPIPGTTEFESGVTGTSLNLDRATLQVIDALNSPDKRSITLSLGQSAIPRPSTADLETMLKQIINVSGFDGIVEVYLQDMESDQNVHFAVEQGADLTPNIAFSAWSTIKIPVMVSSFKVLNEPAPDYDLALMEGMIEQSENTSTDELAMTVIDENLAPILVTEDMQTLGLDNTFWGAYFYLGAPPLQLYTTPANSRDDVDTGPDAFLQTTTADMGMLLEDIYQCQTYNGGALIAAFPGEISQQECDLMVTYLARNQIAVLIQAGVPSGTTVAHKHGWANETDGLLHTIGDVALVYTPGGDYVLSIFVHHPVQAVFDPVNELFAQLSQAIYNYFNIDTAN